MSGLVVRTADNRVVPVSSAAMSGLVVGAGCSRGCPAQELLDLIGAVLDEAGAQPGAVRALATVDRRADEPGMVAAARHHGWPLVTHPAPALRAVAVPTPVGRGRRSRRHAERRRGGGPAERRRPPARPQAPLRARDMRPRGGVVSIFVATDACKGCGACLATCPERALRPAPGGWLLRGEAPLVTLADRCTGCGECMEICPADAFVEQVA